MPGYIKLHRQLLDSQQFRNPNHLKVWIWMLLKASHKQRVVSLKIGPGYTNVELEIGQFVFGRNKAEEELDIDASMIYRVLKIFETDGSIIVKSNNQYSIITICNFETYNNELEYDEQPVNSQRTASEQPVNTDNKVKKVKKNGSKLPLSEKEQIFLNIMVEVTGKKFKVLSDKTRRQFNELVKLKYTRHDIKRAAQTALLEMTERNTQEYLTPEFITRMDEFEKYITMGPKQIIDSNPSN